MNLRVFDLIIEHKELTKKLAKEIASEIKKECSTYGEVTEAIDNLRKGMVFKKNGIEIYEQIIDEVEKIIEKEKNEIPLSAR